MYATQGKARTETFHCNTVRQSMLMTIDAHPSCAYWHTLRPSAHPVVANSSRYAAKTPGASTGHSNAGHIQRDFRNGADS